MLTVPRPNHDEFAPFYAAYVARMETDVDSIQQLASQRDAVVDLLKTVAETRAAFRYAPDRWSIKEVVGHVGDAERIFGYRLLRIARADETALPGFDEDAYVKAAGFDRRPLSDLLADWVTVRSATVSLVRGIEPAHWERRGSANGHPVSARALFYIMLGHVDHHCQVLKDRYGL
jgi:DinB superfamily